MFVCLYVCVFVDSYNFISTTYTRWLKYFPKFALDVSLGSDFKY